MSSYEIHTSDTFMFKISTKIKKLRIDAEHMAPRVLTMVLRRPEINYLNVIVHSQCVRRKM